MYLKIIKHLNNENGVMTRDSEEHVVPKTVHLYECQEASYTKYKVYSAKEALNKLPRSHTSIGGWPSEDEMDWFEFIVISYTANEGNLVSDAEKYIVAPCCFLYVENAEGQTIDNVACHWGYSGGKAPLPKEAVREATEAAKG